MMNLTGNLTHTGKLISVGAIFALGLTACGAKDDAAPALGEESVVEAVQSGASSEHHADVTAALTNDMRPDEDNADDAARKPGAVLVFSGIKPGMSVFEMEAGSGYYTELISRIVGPDGSVVMQNPESFDAFLGDAVPNRLADDRLANVRHSKSNFDALEAADASIDVVTWILGPHDLYYTPAGGGTLGDVDATYAEIARILKPGGAFIVLDHVAEAGAPETSGNTVHRIDPAIVKGLATNAGMVFVEESDVLANPDDDYSMMVFDPKVRRNTDRFLHKYVKPE